MMKNTGGAHFDFVRFKRSRSWYKHLGAGKPFAVFKRKGVQPSSMDVSCDGFTLEDPENEHWWFVLLDSPEIQTEFAAYPVLIFDSNVDPNVFYWFLENQDLCGMCGLSLRDYKCTCDEVEYKDDDELNALEASW